MPFVFSSETQSAILPVMQPDILHSIQLQAIEEGYKVKEEFHVTVLPANSNEILAGEQVDLVESLLENTVVDDITIEDTVFYVTKDKIVDEVSYKRESLIVGIQSKQLNKLLGQLAVITQRGKLPFLHITLFTRGESPYAQRGIGIESIEDFEAMQPQAYILS